MFSTLWRRGLTSEYVILSIIIIAKEELYNAVCCIFYIVTTVSFNQSTYTVNKNDGLVEPILSLSSPPSFEFRIRVREIEQSAKS